MVKPLATRRRSGTVYITVLIVAMIVALMAASAGRLARIHLRGVRNTHEREAAELLAISAIDQALVKFDNEPTWEVDYAFDTEYPATPVSANGGTFAWKLVDLGSGQKRLDGIGRVGDAQCILSVNLGASSASDALQVPLLCGGDLWIGDYSLNEQLYVNGGPACSNGDMKNWNQISGDVEAQTESVLGTVTGSKTVPGTLRSLPNPSSIFDYYMAEGTTIPATAIPLNPDLQKRELQDCLLSPTSNPFGATDPDGIYIIDNPGININIGDCRIVGTLIIRNAVNETKVQKSLNWEPARANWPALMVEGPLQIVLEDSAVSESDLGVNLNPTGTPWQGATDGDTSDSYPNAMAGIIYTTGNLLIDGKNAGYSADIEGVVICGGWCVLEKEAQPSLLYDNTAALDPPPGFGSGDSSSIVGGSWRQTAAP